MDVRLIISFKTGFPDEFCAQRATFLADATVSKAAAMVTNAVAMAPNAMTTKVPLNVY